MSNRVEMCCWLAGLLGLVLAGCGGDGRVSVTGTVSYDGRPVEQGTISFVPLDPSQAPEGGGIVDGRFALSVPPGKKQVQITGSRPLPADQQDSESGGPLYEDYIPPRFNTESTLTAEVKAGEQNQFVFELLFERE